MIELKTVFKKQSLVFMMLVLTSGAAVAGDSFVGNGGSAGDLELLVAEKQLQQTFYEIQSADLENALCTCEPIFEGRGECAPLVGLTKNETLYCSDQLKKMSGKASRMLKNKSILFRWTKEDIYVRQGKKTSTADAVANSANDTITLNQQRFLALTDTERLFLLAHEIFHLVPFGKGESYLDDEGAVGPYDGAQGSRRLLNAMASGTVVEAHRGRALQTYRHVLNRRKSYNTNWLDLTLTPSQQAADAEESVYAQDSFTGFSLGYRKYFGAAGVSLKYTRLTGDKQLLSSIDVEEEVSTFGAGLSYRIFPVKNPLSFWGQSFLNIDVHVELMAGEVFVGDRFTSLTSEDKSTGGSVDLKYYVPLPLCWVHIGAGLRSHELDYAELNFKNDKLQPYFNLGVSHAF